MLAEVGRSMSRLLKNIGLTGVVPMWLLAHTASGMWARCCNARACRHCGWQSIQRVVCGLDAALLEHVVVEVDIGSLVA